VAAALFDQIAIALNAWIQLCRNARLVRDRKLRIDGFMPPAR